MFSLFENKDNTKRTKITLKNGGGDNAASGIVGGLSNVDRLKGNKGNFKSTLQRMSQYNSETQSLSSDTLLNMETLPKDLQQSAMGYYSALSNYNRSFDKLRRSKKGAGFNNIEANEQTSRLHSIAKMDEVREILDKLATEIIITGEQHKTFADYKIDRFELEKMGIKSEIIDMLDEQALHFLPKIYRQLGFRNNGAYNKFIRFMTEGKLAYELVYDDPDNPKEILDIVEINPNNLTPIYHAGSKFWVYKFEMDSEYAMSMTQLGKEINNGQRLLYDWQVNMIDWSEANDTDDISYVNSIMRSANTLRIMEEATVIYTVTRSQFRTIHKVPTQGMVGTFAATAVSKEKEDYFTEIQYNTATGELFIDDSANIPFERSTFVADGDFGMPSIDTLNDRGNALDNKDQNQYFKAKLYRASRLPQSRFDQDGGDWSIDPTRAQREEVFFAGFCTIVKNSFASILLKPLYIQLSLEVPEIGADSAILENISLNWNNINQFRKLVDLAVLQETINYITTLYKEFTFEGAEGEEIPILPPNYLLEKYMDFTEDDLEMLKEYREKWIKLTAEEIVSRQAILQDAGLLDEEGESTIGAGGGGGKRRR